MSMDIRELKYFNKYIHACLCDCERLPVTIYVIDCQNFAEEMQNRLF